MHRDCTAKTSQRSLGIAPPSPGPVEVFNPTPPVFSHRAVVTRVTTARPKTKLPVTARASCTRPSIIVCSRCPVTLHISRTVLCNVSRWRQLITHHRLRQTWNGFTGLTVGSPSAVSSGVRFFDFLKCHVPNVHTIIRYRFVGLTMNTYANDEYCEHFFFQYVCLFRCFLFFLFPYAVVISMRVRTRFQSKSNWIHEKQVYVLIRFKCGW